MFWNVREARGAGAEKEGKGIQDRRGSVSQITEGLLGH